jgi:broad specificity phosphatase PhoE
MAIYLVRHGQTAHNRDGLGLGRHDAPLTELGKRQSVRTAERLGKAPVARVVSSPLGRAGEAASAIAAAHGIGVEWRDELTEMDVGETEGLSFREMRVRFPEFLAAWRTAGGVAVPMPGGESLEDVRKRVAGVCAELLAGVAEGVVVVSHNFVIRVLICDLLGLAVSNFRAFRTDLASISTLEVGEGRPVLVGLNDTTHLAGLEP